MGLSVKVDLEAYPKGIPLGIVGVGVVNNGETLEVPPGGEENFFHINGYTIEDAMKDQEGMTVSGSAEFTPPSDEEAEPAPTLTIAPSTTESTSSDDTPTDPEPQATEGGV